MYQTKKDYQWYFGMKPHIDVDKVFSLIHSVGSTSANVHDITRVLHGEKKGSEIAGKEAFFGFPSGQASGEQYPTSQMVDYWI